MDAHKPRTSDVPATPASRGRSSFREEFAQAGGKVMRVALDRLRQDFEEIASRLLGRGHPLGGESHARELLSAAESRMREAFAEVDDRARSILHAVSVLPDDADLAHNIRTGCGFIGTLLSDEAIRQLARGRGKPAADVDALSQRLESLTVDHIAACRLRAQAHAAAERDRREASRDRAHTRLIAWIALAIAFASAVFAALPFFGVKPG